MAKAEWRLSPKGINVYIVEWIKARADGTDLTKGHVMKTNMQELHIGVVPGDGIGIEIMAACLSVLNAIERRHGGFHLHLDNIEAGAGYFARTGIDIADEDFERLGEVDAVLLGAIGLPHIRHEDGTEIAPHLHMRTAMGLIAGLRPVRAFPNLPTPLGDPRAGDIDIMIIRESTEGLFASVGKGTVENDSIARETLEITRAVCEPLFDETFAIARRRKAKGRPGRVTCVDKANVFAAMAFFRKIFDERAAKFDGIDTDYRYVDAAALDLVRKPWEFDVMVMENMFGDILSDLGAGIVGGMGFAPCAELGTEHGLFQPAHGSAPDIAGQGLANPTAMFLSAAMMLDWLGERHGVQACQDAADDLDSTIYSLFDDGELHTCDLGGPDGTKEYTNKVLDRLT